MKMMANWQSSRERESNNNNLYIRYVNALTIVDKDKKPDH
jgi:hypothetical protein